MPRFVLNPQIELPHKWNPRESAHERWDRQRGPLNISTRAVPEELRKKWYGMPPSKIELKRRPDTLTF